MNSLAVKRHPSLKPLSRNHGFGLVCAQRLHKAVRASVSDRLRLAGQIREIFGDLIYTYLEDEQRILSPVIADEENRAELQRRHDNVRRLLTKLNQLTSEEDPGLGLFSRIADALDDYVRWEEHTLFPCIEEQLGEERLEQLAEITTAIEVNRTRPTQQLHNSVALNKESGNAETCSCSKPENV